MATEVLSSPAPREAAPTTTSTLSAARGAVDPTHSRSSSLQMNHHHTTASSVTSPQSIRASSAMDHSRTSAGVANDRDVASQTQSGSSTYSSSDAHYRHITEASTSSSASASTSSAAAAAAANPLSPPPTSEISTTFFVQAEYAFASTDPSALSFSEGDVIEVLTRLESGWWDGLLLLPTDAKDGAEPDQAAGGGRRGWFPSNYVRIISDEEAEAWFLKREEEAAVGGQSAVGQQQEEDGQQESQVAAQDQQAASTESPLSPDGRAARRWLAGRIGGEQVEDDEPDDTGPRREKDGVGDGLDDDVDLDDGGGGGGLGALARELLKAHESDSEGDENDDDANGGDRSLFFRPPQANGHAERAPAVDPADCWVPSMTMDGQIFYRNTQTGEESWEQPPAALDGAEMSPVTPSDDRSSIASSRRSVLLRRPGDASPFGVPPRTSSVDRLDAIALGSGFGAYAAARSLPALKMRDDGSGFVPLPSRGGVTNDDALRAFGIGSGSGSGSSRPISEALSTSSAGRASSLISLERSSMARIESELFRPRTDDASRLKQMLVSVDEEVARVIDAAEAYMSACAMAVRTPGGADPDPDVTDLSEAQALDAAVRALVPAIRILVTTARHVIVGLTTLIDDDPAVMSAYATNERIHPAQRRVVAALSKVVFFGHSAVGMAWPQPGAVERLATDTMDLHNAVGVFVQELRRFGSLSELGLGLKSTQPPVFGHERPRGRKREWTRLAIDTLAELRRRGNVVRETLGQATVAEVEARLEDFIVYLADIDIAATLDVDGVLRRDGTVFDQAGTYNELVGVARNGHKRVEALSAQLTDATAMLLLEMLEDKPMQPEPLLETLDDIESTLLALVDIGAAQVAELVQLGWRGRIGRRSLRIAEREKAARHVRSASRSSSLATPSIKTSSLDRGGEDRAEESLVDDKPSAPGRPSLTRSMTSFDQLNPLSRRQSNTPSRMSASSSMTSLSIAENDAVTVSSSRRSSASHLMRVVPFLRNRSGSDVDKRAHTVGGGGGGGSRKKLAQMLGEADVQRLMQSPPTTMTPTLTIPERPAYLGVDYAEDELIMNSDGSVKAGSLPALVERLTFHEMMDPTFNATFLITYRSFATPEQVIELLRARYTLAPPDDLSEDELKDWQDRKQKPIKLRVFNTLKTWVDQHYIGERDGAVLEQIEAFVKSTMVPDVQLQMPAQHLLKAIDRRRNSEDQIQARRLMSVTGMPPPSHVPRIALGKGLRLLDINVLELARQLTLFEAQLYHKIRPIECLHKAWSQTDKPESGANIKAMILTSNRIAGWVAESILSYRDVRKRASIMKHFVLTAEQCKNLNNFSTMAAIMAGLNSTPIIRLKRTREALSTKIVTLMDELDSTLDSGRNFTAYRELLKRVVPPAIPFLGVYLTYLTVLEENSDWLPHPTDPDRKLINFFKRQRSAEIIREIQQYQATPYNLAPVESIRKLIEKSLEAVDRAPDLYEVSLLVEPRETEDVKLARVLRESGML